MSAWRAGRAALWGSVAALVVSAHVAVAAWAMRQHVPGIPAAPDAFEIELAPPEPLAAPAPAVEPAPPEPALAEVGADLPAPEPAPDFTPPPIEPLSPPEMADLVPPPPPDFIPPPIEPLPPPETAAFEPPPSPDFTPPPLVTLPPSDFASLAAPAARLKQPPRQRPERILELAREARPGPERRREPERRETRREQPRTERRAEQRAEQRQAEPQARQPARGRESSGAQPARQTAQGSASRAASAGQIASWQQTVGARITAHMSRTRISGGRGSVTAAVTVTIQSNGRASARLAKGSGDAHVDQALQRQANRMPRMTAPPGGQPASFTVPFRINR